MQTAPKKTILAAVAALALIVGGIWWGGHPADLPPFLRNAFVAGGQNTTVDEALADIEHDYFRPLSDSALANGAIAGAVASLHDPYANYYTPGEFNAFVNPHPMHFAGVGVDIDVEHAGLIVEDVLAGSPAARAGVKAGDLILGADGKSFVGRSAAYSTGLIRGKPGTVVTLRIRRGHRELMLPIRRALVNEPLVTGVMRTVHGVRIAVIELPTFDVPGIHTEVASTLEGLLHAGAKAIVLDLRDNGGGLVSEARLVASMFIAHGVIVTTRGRTQPTVTLDATGDPLAASQPMAVLVNRDTASAAEIVAGALQDDHRATIVGTHTYGKGVYQELRPLANGGAIDVTVGEYFLPNGRNLGDGGLKRGAGITPNVIVQGAVTPTRDPALTTALRLLAARVR
jgi:carboxyl-terminal processing protease